MRLHWLQHVPFEGLGCIEPWAAAKAFDISCTRLFADEPLPAIGTFDWLVIMGGPMGIYDLDEHPWLAAEKKFIKSSIDAGKTVLGICLGAQLIADVLGAKGIPNRVDPWGREWDHDWPSWRAMLPRYLDELL